MTAPGDGAILARACAKVNLTLAVQGRRDDGFHEIRSLVAGIGLADTIRFASAKPGEIRLSCDAAGVPVDGTNLVVRAARSLSDRTGVRGGARIELIKAIPVGGGLGGGSSDAAATLIVLNQLWTARASESELVAIGAEIGSDVPLFFRLPTAVVRGRGELVEPVRLRWSGWIVLVLGGFEVPTREVYAAWRTDDRSRTDVETAVRAILTATRAVAIRPMLFNDLEPAVFRLYPQVRRLRDRVRQHGGLDARVSGAGSTIYTIHDDEQEARSFAETLRQDGVGVGVHVARVPHDRTTTTA